MLPTKESQWFSEEVAPHAPALRVYLARRFPSLPDHEDIVQETFSRTLRAWKLGRLTHVKGFLFTAAKNAAIDLIRRRHAHETIVGNEPPVMFDESLGAVEIMDQRQRLDVLLDALSALPSRCRQVMLLRYHEGRSYKEIATHLGISPETVKIHLLKGIRSCTLYFQQRGLLDADKAAAATV